VPIPDTQTLLLPVLKLLSDDRSHEVEEIREHLKNQFSVTSSELNQKHKNGTTVFVNRVAWALAHLNMEAGPIGHPRHIVLIQKGTYRLSKHGKAILNKNPSHLAIKDLRR
jgi:restriction system protein